MVSRSDDELIAELNVDRPWAVRAGALAVLASSLREALLSAHKQSARGESVMLISRMPESDIVIEVPQIVRLWNRLGLLGN